MKREGRRREGKKDVVRTGLEWDGMGRTRVLEEMGKKSTGPDGVHGGKEKETGDYWSGRQVRRNWGQSCTCSIQGSWEERRRETRQG